LTTSSTTYSPKTSIVNVGTTAEGSSSVAVLPAGRAAKVVEVELHLTADPRLRSGMTVDVVIVPPS
jgi:hypothetical protein